MRKILLVVCGIILMFTAGCGRDNLRFFSASEKDKFVKEHNLKNLPKFDVPIVMNDRVIAWMDYFQGPGRKHYSRYLERSGRYLPMMRKILKQQGLPQDLVYVALIESGFNDHAYSRAKAAGSWQFMYRTGVHYGLKVDSWVDERRDPVKATYAASKYFSTLYNEFGDWYLAMAGYNAGEGRVRRAIRMTGSKDFWEIIEDRNTFRAETRDYVPKFIAAAIIAKRPKDFGFDDVEYHDPIEFEEVYVDSCVDLEVLAKCADTGKEEIINLNPELIRGVTPPYGRTVKIPVGKSEMFVIKLAEIPKEKRVTVAYHKVRRGETLGRIARKYKISLSELIAMNNLKPSQKIFPGQRILVSSKGGYVASNRGGDSDYNEGNKKLTSYTIKSGDTLGTIAEREGVSVASLKSWNRLGQKSKIITGKKLKIYKSAPRQTYETAEDGFYVVKSGETLSTIARRHKTTTANLVALNNIGDARLIKEGQKIMISKSDVKANNETVSNKQSNVQPIVVKNSRTTKTYYTVKKGDTVSQIAGRYSVKSSDVLAWNNLKSPKNLVAGRKIIILHSIEDTSTGDDGPTRLASNKSFSVPNTQISTKHKIQSGESLYAISQKYGVSVDEMMIWNNIKNPKRLRAGQTLIIRKPSQITTQERTVVAEKKATPILPPQKVEGSTSDKNWLKYQIRPGDTLWNISKNFGVTIAEIKQWNEMIDATSLKEGDMIAIYKPSNN